MPIRVLVVDDSALMRKLVTSMFAGESDFDVVGHAVDGLDALRMIGIHRPDVVTMDVEMPNLDGIGALTEIMAHTPTPVVMLSSLTQAGAETTMRCLEIGAVDFVGKPSGSISLDIATVRTELLSKVRHAVGARLHRWRPVALKAPTQIRSHVHIGTRQKKGLLVIGASTGGPRALQNLIPMLPGDLGVPVVVIQHMPPNFTASMAKRLNDTSNLEVVEAKQGDTLVKNVVLIAPGGFHLEFDSRNRANLSTAPLIHGVRPAVDITMSSLLKNWGSQMVAVLLTGMGKDGAAGLKAVHDSGGATLAEHESTCVVYGMPRAAVELGGVDKIVPLDEMPDAILSALNGAVGSQQRSA